MAKTLIQDAAKGRANRQPPSGAPDREKFLRLAHALAPKLRARAEQCARERKTPNETIQDLKDTGLMRLLQPQRFGGYEMGWDMFCEIIQILAAACGSQAWVYRVLADHAQMIGLFPAQAQHDVWGEDPSVLASSSFPPMGRATPVAGGYRLSGKHAFSSGIDHADWIICGGMIEDAAQAGQRRASYFLVPKRDVTIIDDWQVNGLEGTGSKSFEIKDAFVPDHRVLDWDDAAAGRGPGGTVNKAAIFRLPRGGYTTSGFSALAVGMAKGMLEEWLTLTARRRSEGKPIAGLESVQMIAGEASAAIDAAEALYLTNIRDAMRAVEAGQQLPPGGAAAVRCNVAYACQLTSGAVNRLHAAMGSSAVYSGSPIERQFRNFLVGLQHVAVNWPRGAAGQGAELLRQHGAPLPTSRAARD